MKTFKIWMLGLTLPLLAMTPACDDDDGDDDGAGDETGNDDGSNDDGDDDGSNDDGNDDGSNDDGNDDGSNDDGSNDDGSNDDGPAGGDIGDQCFSDDDCSTPICLFAGDVDYGFCSIPCEDVFDCPDFWDCVEVENATLLYCAPDA